MPPLEKHYKIEIVGSDIMEIINRTDRLKKFLVENCKKHSFNEIRTRLYYDYGIEVYPFYPPIKEMNE